MPKIANWCREAFCVENMKDRNATAVYKRSGYAPKNDGTAAAGSKLLRNHKVAARFAELEAAYAEKVGFEPEDILTAHLAVLRADQSKLTKPVRGACRYCHGFHYEY